MVKKTLLLVLTALFGLSLHAQIPSSPIQSMRWERDYKLYLELDNDSNYVMDIKELHHSAPSMEKGNRDYTYYPVRLGEEFVNQLKNQQFAPDTSKHDTIQITENTLWSAIHYSIGGGWVHFINTLHYSLEKGALDIAAPLMKRPESKWKPNPVTESYKRTKKWDYYVPVNHRLALKEYKIRKEEGSLGDLQDVPEEFIQLFLDTSPYKYRKMRDNGDRKQLAKIDLVKLLLGAKYLGKAQIKYIKGMVLRSFNEYTENQLPSVIILDNYQAAVAMNLNTKGYEVEKIVFANQKEMTPFEIESKTARIKGLIDHINQVNKEMFERKLGNYYSN